VKLGQNQDLVCYRKKQSFRQCEEKISTASDQYILSYVKKLQGGVKLAPPPAGIGLRN